MVRISSDEFVGDTKRLGARFAALTAALVTGAAAWGAMPDDKPAPDPSRLPTPVVAEPGNTGLDVLLSILVQEGIGITRSELIGLDLKSGVGEAMSLALTIEGQPIVLDIGPYSTRSAKYQVLVQGKDGFTREVEPGPISTVRGAVRGTPGTTVAGALLDDGLHLMIDLGDEQYWLEPVSRFLPELSNRYVLYRNDAVLPHGGTCGVPDAVGIGQDAPRAGVDGGRDHNATQGGGVCIAELACDADTEYFNAYGSVANVEARINSVINAVNLQYEAQVGLTHQITTIVVRTGSDPYTSSDAQTRLCQFITEWTNNQQSVPRDVAHLFTGVEIDGGTIGIASDIGGTGICVNQGACTGGTYGTQGSYCLSQSDFNGNFSCATDLTAHELGHLWGAFHCSCPSNTMNPSITCANNFSGGTINSISNYRDTRTCLDGSCSGGPTPPANDLCADAEVIAANGQVILSNLNATPVSGAGDSDLPSGSPSCQWQGNPNAVHNTVWYAFVAEDTSVEVQTCATTAIQDTILALYGGSCGNLTQLACSEDACGSSTYMSSICFNGLTPGQTYFVMVGNPGGWSGSTPGQIVLDIANPCPSVGPVAGACCLPGGACDDFTLSADCANAGGTFQGAGSDCGGANCPADSGACCFGDGSCTDTSSAACASAGGSFQGNGTDCSPNPCPQPASGACCFVDGSCTEVTATSCAGAGGTYSGDGTVCSPNPCPQPATGACCFVDGSCTEVTATSCAGAGGTYSGDGTVCSPNPCPQPPATGACCFANGSCSVVTSASCVGSGGTYQGDDTDCSPNPCPQPPATGACCLADESCAVDTAANCAGAGGTYQGDGTDCSPNPCASEVVNIATADFSTGFGSITAGSFASTHTQNDVREAIREEQTNGNPNRRRSRLQHTWTFNVAVGNSYTFSVDAHHTANGEGDDFVFSYSKDNAGYTTMLTVTKTADNDGLQTYAFPEDVAGTLYVRVEDTDRSQGNSAQDTVFIDEMFVVSSNGGSDTTPPANPTGLDATAGDNQVALNWSDNGDPDLAGYNVYRGTSSGGPYTQLNGALVASSEYVDGGAVNGSVYYYVVTAVDTAGNESGNSGEASASPQGPGGTPFASLVDSIVVSTENIGGGNKRGRADVVVRDNLGNLVANATVEGTFSGDLNETVTAVTNANGVAILRTTVTKKGSVSITFCVDDISHASLAYNPGANVETCDVN